MSIKYYRLAKDEELPDEFCAVRDINGEPSEYTFYEQMNEFDRYVWAAFKQSDWFAGSEYRKLQAENAKLRELVSRAWRLFTEHGAVHPSDLPEVDAVRSDMREMGMEVDE